ncbi:MAG: heme-binding protein, partial [Planctomycetaceae bacterium]|nr:heme-binding protein [Planctomycetaceae bacterium]
MVRPSAQRLLLFAYITILCVPGAQNALSQNLTTHLLDQTNEALAAQIRMRGDPMRGALLFHRSTAGCIKCHSDGQSPSPLGPKLTDINPSTNHTYLIESVLNPSKAIREGYETVSIVTTDGKVRTGLVVSQNDTQVVLRELVDLLHPIVISQHDIDVVEKLPVSMMPAGLVDSLRNEGEFYDLMRYVFEVVHGGPSRALELRPSPEELVIEDDSIGIDHAGILQHLGSRDFKSGKKIYLSHCQNCHGANGNEPTMPLARAFGTEPLKNGSDPYSMFMTLTKGR